MDAKTREALEASIQHWRDNVSADRVEDSSTGEEACALCKAFADDDDCQGCPVAEATGRPNCSGSPYYNAYEARCVWNTVNTPVNRDAFRAAAQEELNFLISLRPSIQSHQKENDNE